MYVTPKSVSGRVVKMRIEQPPAVPATIGNIHFGAGRAADPVALLRLDLLEVVHRIQVGEQPLGVGGDPQHPLLAHAPDDRAAAALALAADDLLVRQPDLAASCTS